VCKIIDNEGESACISVLLNDVHYGLNYVEDLCCVDRGVDTWKIYFGIIYSVYFE
jgi:hypothetical protein